jgi:hypothetical protein
MNLVSLGLATVILVASCAPGSSQIVVGDGTQSCGSWSLERPPGGHGVSASGVAMFSWILGYLSGANVNQKGSDFIRQTDSAGILAWMNNYCQKNPLNKIYQGADELKAELTSRARR